MKFAERDNALDCVAMVFATPARKTVRIVRRIAVVAVAFSVKQGYAKRGSRAVMEPVIPRRAKTAQPALRIVDVHQGSNVKAGVV